MRRLASRPYAVAAVVAVAVIGASAFSPAAGHPGPAAVTAVNWIRISSNTKQAGDSAGLYRTADARLHVAWSGQDGPGSFSLHYSTLGAHAKVVATGTIVSKWASMAIYPRLVPGPAGGIRVVFPGADGKQGSPFNNSDMYSATAEARRRHVGAHAWINVASPNSCR
jgi:hypothetical protein